jgi:hypothetical protein
LFIVIPRLSESRNKYSALATLSKNESGAKNSFQPGFFGERRQETLSCLYNKREIGMSSQQKQVRARRLQAPSRNGDMQNKAAALATALIYRKPNLIKRARVSRRR